MKNMKVSLSMYNNPSIVLQNILQKYDDPSLKNIQFHHLHDEIKKLYDTIVYVKSISEIAESIAFAFKEYEDIGNNRWKTNFGPLWSEDSQDATFTDYPSLEMISELVLQHWISRIEECQNPILKARYAGLVYDLSYKASGLKPNHEITRKYIEALLEVVTGEYLKHEVNGYKKLRRALELSISLRDNKLKEKVVIILWQYEMKVAKDDMVGSWGHCYDLLVKSKKKRFAEQYVRKIINELEARLLRLGEVSEVNLFAIKNSMGRLIEYYYGERMSEDVKRVIKYGEVVLENLNNKGLNSSDKIELAEYVCSLYKNHGFKEDRQRLLKVIRKLGKENVVSIGTHSFEFEISKEDIDVYKKELISDSISGTLLRFYIVFLPRKADIVEYLKTISNQFVFPNLFPIRFYDKYGRNTARVGTFTGDVNGAIMSYFSDHKFNIETIFMSEIVKELIKEMELDAKKIVSFIKKSALIDESRYEILNMAIEAYFDRNFIVFLHLIIPQIEGAIRNFIEFSGGNVLKEKNDTGVKQLKTFDDILRDELIIEKLGEDFSLYFRGLFTDPRGWNLRNEICHGMLEPEGFSQITADRVLHALIVLGAINKT